jgi:hypothetical protein
LNLPEPTDPSFPGFRRVTRLDLPSVPAAPRLPRELWLRFAQLRTLAEADAEGRAQIRTDALLGFADAADMALVRLELVCVGVETWSVRLLRRRLRLVDASIDFVQILYDAERDEPCAPEEFVAGPTKTVLRSSGGGELVARSIHMRAHETPTQTAVGWPEPSARIMRDGIVDRFPPTVGSGEEGGVGGE